MPPFRVLLAPGEPGLPPLALLLAPNERVGLGLRGRDAGFGRLHQPMSRNAVVGRNAVAQ